MYVLHNALHVSDPPGESKPLMFYSVLPTGSPWRFHECSLRHLIVPRQSPQMSSSPLSAALRDKSTAPVGVMDLLERRSSPAVTQARMALSAVSADLPTPQIC